MSRRIPTLPDHPTSTMSSSHPLSAAPANPYSWRESVLSTRSLSCISNAGSLASPAIFSSAPSRDTSHSYFYVPNAQDLLRQVTQDVDLEMEDATKEVEHVEEHLPDSVSRSLLFELPREIRDRIYAVCLTAKDGLPVEWPADPSLRHASHIQPQLLRTCKIIYDEAAPLLYTLNCLDFRHPSDGNIFVRAMASRAHAWQITLLSLHIKAQDMRMWFPYLTSTEDVRSLKADFPNLKEISVRYRSNKWMHTQPPESNLRTWFDDSRLDELIAGLRHVYYPARVEDPDDAPTEQDIQDLHDASSIPLHMLRERLSRQPRSEHHASVSKPAATIVSYENPPQIRICCTCKVHSSHFTALTNPLVPYPQLPPPVVDGEDFRGFNPVDLQNGVMKICDSELGLASVARTPYAMKDHILLSLEIHCLDSKRDAAL